MIRIPALCLAATVALAPASWAQPPAGSVSLRETGSTLLLPVFQRWIADYAGGHGVTMSAAGTGSGAGIADAIAGRAELGASDAYMSDEESEHNPGVMNIPLAISAQTVNFNLPGIASLRLDGHALAGIYAGRIASWGAPEIARLNPGVTLPQQPIVPVRREDAAGDTFIFTQFLDFSTQSWEDGPGYGTSIDWPEATGEKTATGNAGMVRTIAATPGSIGYVGVSFGDEIAKAKLGTVMLGNQSGAFLTPTPETIGEAASTLDVRTPADERLSLVDAPGANSYPLVNYEYVVVDAHQQNPATAAAIRQFLYWAVGVQGGNAPRYLQPAGFIVLPDFIRALSEKQIAKIQ